MRVAVIGCGAVGGFVARWLSERDMLAALYDIDTGKALKLSKVLGAPAAGTFEEFLEYDADIVVEAASQQAVRDYAAEVLKSRKDMLVLSVGAFADAEFYEEIRRLAAERGRRIYVPSGAIAGTDALTAVASVADEVILTTRKSPSSLGTDRRGLIFEGDAREAAKLFPKNMNVAAVLGLAVGFEKVRCRIIADDVGENVHEIVARGEFGEVRIEVRNRRMYENPRTSYLAALSVIKTLQNLESCVVIG